MHENQQIEAYPLGLFSLLRLHQSTKPFALQGYWQMQKYSMSDKAWCKFA